LRFFLASATPSGFGRITRGNTCSKSRLKTLPIAAKRCARRPIPDSRRIHYPSLRYSTGDSMIRDCEVRVMFAISSAFTRDPSKSSSHVHSLEPAQVRKLVPVRARGAISLRPRLCALRIPVGRHLTTLGVLSGSFRPEATSYRAAHSQWWQSSGDHFVPWKVYINLRRLPSESTPT
jgi:hypothetical protein